MKHFGFATAIVWFLGSVGAIGQVTLDQVLAMVRANAPELQVRSMIIREATLQSEILTTRKLPAISVSGQATYQSEVTSVPIVLPGVDIPTAPQLQYKFQSEVIQSVFDGGVTALLQRSTGNAADRSDAEVEMQLEQVRERAIRLFFGLIELQSSRNILTNKAQQLLAQRELLQSRVDNGVVLESELHALDAALLEVRQQQVALQASTLTLTYQLAVLTGDPLSDTTTVFVRPSEPAPVSSVATDLPAYRAFAARNEQVAVQLALEEAAARPQLQAFGQAGIGQPGLDFLDEELSGFYIVGLRARLNLGRLYTKKKEEEVAAIAADKINAARASFNRQLESKIVQYRHDIDMFESQRASNTELVRLREQITRIAKVQFDNGAITSADYISVLNDENTAREQLERSEVRKRLTQYLLQHLTGNYDKTQ